MEADPRTPVLVGCGQITQRIDDPRESSEPLALMRDAALLAAQDAGAPSLLGSVDAVRVCQGLWDYANPAAWLGEHFSDGRVHTGIGPISGSTVQLMLHHAANEILEGKRDVVLLAAAEAERSRRRARKLGVELEWSDASGPEPDEKFSVNDPSFGWWEKTYRPRPVQAFSMFENAVRHDRGESLEAHRARIAALWARLARIAADNPNAWIRDAPDARAIATPSADNRMLAYPYTKLFVANMVVDEGAALILCSLEAARRHGVSDDRIVYLHAGTDVSKMCPVADRFAYHDQPAIGLAGRRAFELARTTPGEVDHVDLYSCFPSAVQIGAAELGFDEARDLSVTGGLTFAGGPFNSFVMHSTATMMNRLRSRTGSRGFISGVGGYMAKHGFSVLGTEPPAAGRFRHACLDEEALALPTRRCLRDFDGDAVVETFAVMPDATGEPSHLLCACLTDAGERVWATCSDAAVVAGVSQEELCGRPVRVSRDGVLEVRR